MILCELIRNWPTQMSKWQRCSEGIPSHWKDTGRDVRKLIECATPKVKSRAIDVRVLLARELFTRFFCEAKLLKGMVARDGIEPPTPAFSGQLTVSRKWFEIKVSFENTRLMRMAA